MKRKRSCDFFLKYGKKTAGALRSSSTKNVTEKWEYKFI